MNPNLQLFLRSAVSGILAVALGRGKSVGPQPGEADPLSSRAGSPSTRRWRR
jgi:hypothetical protein